MEIMTFRQSDLPAVLAARVVALEAREWPDSATSDALSHDPALNPVYVVLLDDDTVVASLAILSKELTHCGLGFSASGLSAVVTDPLRRGRGCGGRIVTAGREFIERSGADLGIFTCRAALVDFYESCGWIVLPGTVLVGGTVDAPFPSDQLGGLTMAAFFTPRARRHANLFEHARVELYPGTIDKLW
ncbi:MAG: GNAT family N-acetyltransferase [Chloroflexi bacterium]|nr:GNAT family N-acetyltransferase [Chloroflexota bacterium]